MYENYNSYKNQTKFIWQIIQKNLKKNINNINKYLLKKKMKLNNNRDHKYILSQIKNLIWQKIKQIIQIIEKKRYQKCFYL